MSNQDQFETWVREEWPNASLSKYNNGSYRKEAVQRSWVAWQASREALVFSASVLRPELSGQVSAELLGSGVTVAE